MEPFFARRQKNPPHNEAVFLPLGKSLFVPGCVQGAII